MQFIPQDGVYTYFRYDDSECVMVIANNTKDEKNGGRDAVCGAASTGFLRGWRW